MSISPDLSKFPIQVLQQAVTGAVPTIIPYAALSELSRRIKSQQMQQQMQGQTAMQQNQQQSAEPPIAQQVVQASEMDRGIGGLPAGGGAYAAGGVVAFSDGKTVRSGTPQPLEYSSDAGMVDPGMPNPYADEATWQRYRFRQEAARQGKRVRLTPEEEFALSDPVGIIGRSPAERPVDLAKQGFRLVPGVGLVDKDNKPVAGTTPQPPAAAAPARSLAPTAPAATPPIVQAGAYKFDPDAFAGGNNPFAPGAQKPTDDAELRAATKLAQDTLERSKVVSPEVLEARKRSNEMMTASSARREADRAKMEAELKARSGRGFLDNSEALMAAAGAIARSGRLGTGLGAASEAVNAQMGAQRKEMLEQQAALRTESNLIDALKQAQADKQLAIISGDSNAVKEADAKIASIGVELQKTRAEIAIKKETAAAHTESAKSEARRAATGERAQVEIERHNPAMEATARAQVAATAANREGIANRAERQLALRNMQADPEFKAIQDRIKSATMAASVAPNAPTIQAKLRAAQEAAVKLAKKHNVDSADLAQDMGTTSPPGAGTSTSGWR